MNTGLEALAKKRKRWVLANRENDFEQGIRNLLTQLYPDNAHFIYELLQNAEDAHASDVKFTLGKKKLEFEHDGQRLFSLADVTSITSIGKTTKLDDPTNIGEFGVGFKAVFAYTNTPEIHSGEYHFRVHDLVVPEGIANYGADEKKTRFIFPFDNPKKSCNKAIEEITQGLNGLEDNALLFLNHIHKIEFSLPNGSQGSQERIKHNDKTVEIRNYQTNGEKSASHWLLFDKTVRVKDDDGKEKDCSIAVAYNLTKEGGKNKHSKWRVIPLDRGQVFIYFPAVKEDSHLLFHIHAPFAAPVGRDSVRTCEANQDLRDHFAEMVSESLVKIRDKGMLDVSFLAVLPNPDDNLPEFYEPIRCAIVKAFKEQDLTPTRNGKYAKSVVLYRGLARIAEVLDDKGLSQLTNYNAPCWAANAPLTNPRADRFIESLGIDEWGWSELTDIINPSVQYGWSDEEFEDENNKQRIENFIQQMEDAKLLRFYALMGEAIDEHYQSVCFDEELIIRVVTSGGDKHVAAAYFALENDIKQITDIAFVKPEVYSAGRSETQKKYAKSFLEHIGVRTYDEEVVIEKLLEPYSDEDIPSKTHINHIIKFTSFWEKNPIAAKRIFYDKRSFLLSKKGDAQVFFSPDELCLDEPYLDTGLSELTQIHKKNVVSSYYEKALKKSDLVGFIAFLKEIGVMFQLEIEQDNVYNNPARQILYQDYRVHGVRWTNTAINCDYTILNLTSYLKSCSIPASSLIWNALIKATPNIAKAQFRPNASYKNREADSTLIYHLKHSAWIPNKSGEFCSPQEMAQDSLRTDFPFDDRNGLLTLIGFGENAREESEEYHALNQAAQNIGFTSDPLAREVAEIIKSVGIEAIRNLKKPQQPEGVVTDPGRRRKGVLERRENAPTNESVVRERKIQPGTSKEISKAKAYLRAKYKNKDDQLICQCCDDKMPFKLKQSGEHYFEAVQCIPGLDKHYFENRLALCPNCAAMYQHARETEESEIERLIVKNKAVDKAPWIEIPIQLAGSKCILGFVGTHFFDLKTVLKNRP